MVAIYSVFDPLLLHTDLPRFGNNLIFYFGRLPYFTIALLVRSTTYHLLRYFASTTVLAQHDHDLVEFRVVVEQDDNFVAIILSLSTTDSS